MFGKTSSTGLEQAEKPSQQKGSYIAKGVIIEGVFRCDGDIQIDGELKGELHAKGAVHLGAGATVTGPIQGTSAKISGALNGAITLTEGIEITSAAILKGDITAMSIAVEKGAVIEGQVRIKRHES